MDDFVKKNAVISILLIIILFLITSCSSVQNDRTKANPIVIAYLPNEGSNEVADLRVGMADAMSQAIGIEVKELICTDYNAAIEALRFGHADLALLGAINVIQAERHADSSPIVIVAEGGSKETSGYTSYFVARSDNGDINSINDIMGRDIAFVDPTSTSGNMVPCAEILAAYPDLNLTIEDLNTSGAFFNNVVFSGSHLAGVMAVAKGDVDVAPCASDTFDQITSSGKINLDTVKIIFESRKIPSSAFVARNDLNNNTRDLIVNFLVNYDDAAYFEYCLWDATARFIECSMDDYREIAEITTIMLDK